MEFDLRQQAEDLLKNAETPEARIIAMMAIRQADTAELVGSISSEIIQLAGNQRRMDERQEKLITELEKAYNGKSNGGGGGSRPDFSAVRLVGK